AKTCGAGDGSSRRARRSGHNASPASLWPWLARLMKAMARRCGHSSRSAWTAEIELEGARTCPKSSWRLDQAYANVDPRVRQDEAGSDQGIFDCGRIDPPVRLPKLFGPERGDA